MQVVVPILIVVAVLVVGAVVLAIRRRSSTNAVLPRPDVRTKASIPEPPPMNDLESALSEVTDSTGRPIGERIDAEAAIVDDLKVPDDTGPLLRRALDNVVDPATEHTADADADRPANAGEDTSAS